MQFCVWSSGWKTVTTASWLFWCDWHYNRVDKRNDSASEDLGSNPISSTYHLCNLKIILNLSEPYFFLLQMRMVVIECLPHRLYCEVKSFNIHSLLRTVADTSSVLQKYDSSFLTHMIQSNTSLSSQALVSHL